MTTSRLSGNGDDMLSWWWLLGYLVAEVVIPFTLLAVLAVIGLGLSEVLT